MSSNLLCWMVLYNCDCRQCSFVSKAVSAAEAGAQFVIISDDDVGSTNTRIDMVHDETNRKVYIPTLFIAGKDG